MGNIMIVAAGETNVAGRGGSPNEIAAAALPDIRHTMWMCISSCFRPPTNGYRSRSRSRSGNARLDSRHRALFLQRPAACITLNLNIVQTASVLRRMRIVRGIAGWEVKIQIHM